jgi:hypothetical protein
VDTKVEGKPVVLTGATRGMGQIAAIGWLDAAKVLAIGTSRQVARASAHGIRATGGTGQVL